MPLKEPEASDRHFSVPSRDGCRIKELVDQDRLLGSEETGPPDATM